MSLSSGMHAAHQVHFDSQATADHVTGSGAVASAADSHLFSGVASEALPSSGDASNSNKAAAAKSSTPSGAAAAADTSTTTPTTHPAATQANITPPLPTQPGVGPHNNPPSPPTGTDFRTENFITGVVNATLSGDPAYLPEWGSGQLLLTEDANGEQSMAVFNELDPQAPYTAFKFSANLYMFTSNPGFPPADGLSINWVPSGQAVALQSIVAGDPGVAEAGTT